MPNLQSEGVKTLDKEQTKLPLSEECCLYADQAIAALQKLISCEYEAARTRIVVSGECQTCSQKIHNLQRGILEASHDSKYVLCLDDDIQLHPGFLQTAVQQLESHPSAFMLTGVAHQLAKGCCKMYATRTITNSNTYAILAGTVFHLPLLL